MSNLEKIQDYLDGSMPEKDRLTFQRELSANETLKKEYEEVVLAKKIASGLIELDLREVIEKEGKPKKSGFMWFGGIAAAILFICGVYFLMKRDSSGTANYAMVYIEPNWDIRRGDTHPLGKALSEFLNGGDLAVAKTKIQAIEDLDSKLKAYWISEMFLFERQYDSTLYYLPQLPSNSTRLERVAWINDFVAYKQSENQE